MTVKIIAFDLDGVVVDSLHECFIVSVKALKLMGERVENEKLLWEQFKKGRCFVLAARDFYPVLKAVMENKNIDFSNIRQEDFDRLKRQYKHGIKKFDEKFYRVRSKMIEDDFESWMKLNRIYPNIAEALKYFAGKYRIAIATAKEKNQLPCC
jgi:FMN phosphatase YigB (HAD superfamily)